MCYSMLPTPTTSLKTGGFFVIKLGVEAMQNIDLNHLNQYNLSLIREADIKLHEITEIIYNPENYELMVETISGQHTFELDAGNISLSENERINLAAKMAARILKEMANFRGEEGYIARQMLEDNASEILNALIKANEKLNGG